MVHGVTAGAGGDPLVFVHFGGGIPVYRTPRDGVIQNPKILSFQNRSPDYPHERMTADN